MLKLRRSQTGAIPNYVIIIGIVLSIVFIAVVGYMNQSDRGVGSGKEYTPPDAPATIAKSEALYGELNNAVRFDALRTDIAYYARNTISAYLSEDHNLVIFTVNNDVKRDNKTITFTGKLDQSKDTLKISVEETGSSGIKTSITNQKEGTNIDKQLPSNDVQQSFSNSLPYKNDLFLIEYNPSINSYTVTAYTAEPTTKQQAVAYIVQQTGKTESQLKILYKPYIY